MTQIFFFTFFIYYLPHNLTLKLMNTESYCCFKHVKNYFLQILLSLLAICFQHYDNSNVVGILLNEIYRDHTVVDAYETGAYRNRKIRIHIAQGFYTFVGIESRTVQLLVYCYSIY